MNGGLNSYSVELWRHVCVAGQDATEMPSDVCGQAPRRGCLIPVCQGQPWMASSGEMELNTFLVSKPSQFLVALKAFPLKRSVETLTVSIFFIHGVFTSMILFLILSVTGRGAIG